MNTSQLAINAPTSAIPTTLQQYKEMSSGVCIPSQDGSSQTVRMHLQKRLHQMFRDRCSITDAAKASQTLESILFQHTKGDSGIYDDFDQVSFESKLKELQAKVLQRNLVQRQQRMSGFRQKIVLTETSMAKMASTFCHTPKRMKSLAAKRQKVSQPPAVSSLDHTPSFRPEDDSQQQQQQQQQQNESHIVEV
eukprot:Nitzschia sp. Nitz4//scaffold226_size53432//32310//32888//NITZ4_006703-RA/size53432-processed-gene-0.77-mRNA-1//-1//CDS//3329542757//8298//frame0